MANLTTNECYKELTNIYDKLPVSNVESVLTDICNCFDSNKLNEFVEFLKTEYENYGLY